MKAVTGHEQLHIQAELEGMKFREGRDALLIKAETAYNFAIAIEWCHEAALSVEVCLRAQGLYLGKGRLWRLLHRPKLWKAARNGMPYEEIDISF